MKQYKILIADDEDQMLLLLTSYLEREGFDVVTANNGEEALSLFSAFTFDLVILDIMMPGVDGFRVCEMIRSISNVPIIMLTAKSNESDRIHGIKIGADDYLIKPFSPKELVVRMEAIFRRINNFNKSSHVLHVKEITINTQGQQVMVNDEHIQLTRKEYGLLLFFVKNKGKVFSREQLLQQIWGFDNLATLRTIDTHIKTLRIKLGVAGEYIKTIWGTGYKLEV